MTNIKKEVPVWVIDWVNKVFTLANTPSQIDDLFYDGAIYTSFTLAWNVLTLVDAPEQSIFVDYEVSNTSQATWLTTCTFWDIKTEVWDLLEQRPSSTNFSDRRVWNKINEVSRDIWRWSITNLLDPRDILMSGRMWFAEDTVSLRIKSWSKLSAEFNIWDTIAEMSTADILPSGYVQIWGDTIAYASKTDTQIEWVSGQTVAHFIWDKVVQLYEMPIDFEKPLKVSYVRWGDNLRPVDIPFSSDESFGCYYNIVRSGNTPLLKIGGLSNDDMVQVKYEKKYYNMTTNSDLCPFPDDYGIKVVANIVAWIMWRDKNLPQSISVLSGGYASLKVMYWFFNNEIKIIKQTLMAKTYSFNSLGRWQWKRK